MSEPRTKASADLADSLERIFRGHAYWRDFAPSIPDRLARIEAEASQPVLREALDTLDGLATAVIRMKLAIPARLGPPTLPAAFFAALGDVNQWLDRNDRVQSLAALAPTSSPEDKE